MLHRAGVAIVLIATLLLPYGKCQPPSRITAHDCCAHHSAPVASVKANCCTVRSELPAIVVERAIGKAAPATMATSLAVAAQPAIRFEATVPAVLSHHSPPPGKSILRI